MTTEWISYAQEQPAEKGVYEWRVPSTAVPGLIVTCFAHMRERGAGYRDVISPVFDHWDGYNVLVPKGLQWRKTDQHANLKWHVVTEPQPEGVENDPCPYCQTIPLWQSIIGSPSGGVALSSDPHRANRWWLECCQWSLTPRFADPRTLANQRNEMLRKYRLTTEP